MTPRTYVWLWAAFLVGFGTLFLGVGLFAARIYLVNPILAALMERR